MSQAKSREYQFDFSSLQEYGVKRIGELNPYITLACDLRCGYCYMFNFLAKALDQTQVIHPDFLFSLVNYLCVMAGGNLDRDTLLGGEPTLHPNITEIANTLADFPIAERRMTTNGISLHNLRLEDLRSDAFDHISVSIDGATAETNDKTRGQKTFEKILATIRNYIDAGIKVSVNYTVTTSNLNSLVDAIRFFYTMGVTIVNFHRASLVGNVHNHQNLLSSPLGWVKARDELFDFIETHSSDFSGLKIRIPYTFLTPAQMVEFNYRPIQQQNYHSPDGGHRMIVFPPTEKGKGLCYMSSDLIGVPDAHLGNLHEDGRFTFNSHPDNELVAYHRLGANNVSTMLTGQEQEIEVDKQNHLYRVSHSFKRVYQL